MAETREVVVIGGGQAGLAAGFFLRRAGLDFAVLDAQEEPGGAWQHFWNSLRLFSPAERSPLPGWWMPRQEGEPFPTAEHVVTYLRDYERRYRFPVERPVLVSGVRDAGEHLEIDTDRGSRLARVVISATGTWDRPHVPELPGREDFRGRQLHTVDYSAPEEFRGQRVVVVGGGNSAAQIIAEVSTVAETRWVTRRPPRFMPDDVDGRVLFDVATQRELARRAGNDEVRGPSDFGDIVVVPEVREARDRGELRAEPMFDRLTPTGVAWSDGTERDCEVIIWCTGFAPALDHLAPLNLRAQDGVPLTEGTRSVDEPRLHLLGYGDWTGSASATIVGASRTAKPAVAAIADRLAAE